MSFEQFTLTKEIKQAVAREGYTEPTPIQAQAIPPQLEGKDILGIAQTGTGKTAAFCLPLLNKLSTHKHIKPGHCRALVLAPTRELAAQITKSVETYGKNSKIRYVAVFGGVGMGPQIKQMRSGVDILVATPGRLLDLVQQGHVRLQETEVFVLDEADRMLDMGFLPDIKKILTIIPQKRQTVLFSATLPPAIQKFANSILHDPVKVTIDPKKTTAETVEQHVLPVTQNLKNSLLLLLLEKEHLESVLVFTRTKHKADKVARALKYGGISADSIHGDKPQNKRTRALEAFHKGKIRVLVATDIAARGIDVDDISHVINYDLPDEAENYVHRIGRTGRAKQEGVAYSFCAPEEKAKLRAIERHIKNKLSIIQMEIPEDKKIISKEVPEGAGRRQPAGNRRGNSRPPRGPRSSSGARTNSGPRHSSGSRGSSGPRNRRRNSGNRRS